MHRAVDHLQDMVPALLFLCAGVPLAALLDSLGFFDAVAVSIEKRFTTVPVASLWVLAALTTAVLNLDTTVVLLTPLYIRLARRTGTDPLALAVIPVLLASFASSVLPVSNLTTLIAAERLGLSTSDVFAHLAPVSLVACVVGWLSYRRRFPTTLPVATPGEVDQRALRIGSVVVLGLLVGFVLGPLWSVPAWGVAVVADLVLVAVTRTAPWRDIPLGTVALVSGTTVVVALVVPADALTGVLAQTDPISVAGVVLGGAAVANAVNNLPALLVALDGTSSASWGTWAWLAGVNTGTALLPLGALANVLWRRIAREEGVEVTTGRHVRAIAPLALPPLLAGAAVMGAMAALTR